MSRNDAGGTRSNSVFVGLATPTTRSDGSSRPNRSGAVHGGVQEKRRFSRAAVHAVSLILLMVWVHVVSSSVSLESGFSIWRESDASSRQSKELGGDTGIERPAVRPRKIAIMSSFVHTDTRASNANAPRITMLDHVLNKVCYADLWGYDFILNTTFGFDKNLTSKAHWLNYGTWHRVPHIQARLHEYDWLLYADIDYIFQDMTVPVQSLLEEFELYGKKNVHIVVPSDHNDRLVFSAFAVLIRNSPFGRRVVEHWMSFAKGICRNGNFETTVRDNYNWMDTDQPGLWYALAETHREFFGTNGTEAPRMLCDSETGFFKTERALGPEFNNYFSYVKAVRGSNGKDLVRVPDHQPIIWTVPHPDTRSGLGVQLIFGTSDITSSFSKSWAIHHKQIPTHMESDIAICRNIRGCRAEYDEEGSLLLGCTNRSSRAGHRPVPK